MDRVKNFNVTYGRVPSELLRRPDVSFKAKGLYAMMEDKPQGWRFSVHRLAKQFKEGTTSISAGLRELEEAGYLRRVQSKDEQGRWFYEYELYASSIEQATLNNCSEDSDIENTVHENTVHRKPVHGKPSNISNTEISNTEIKQTEISISEQAEPARKKAIDRVSKAYYDAVKSLGLPVRNHNNVRTKITQLKRELSEEDCLKYLDFISNIYPTLPEDDYKPRILEALDIYAKRVAVGSWVKDRSEGKRVGLMGY